MEAEQLEDILGKTGYDFFFPELASEYSEDEMKVIHTGEPLLDKEEMVFHADTGIRHWHLTSRIPIVNNQGRITGIIGFDRDIT